jgi:hypothetical protein
MIIDCTEQVELPFMLNLPSGNYPVGSDVSPYLLHVTQEQVAAHLEDGGFAIGSASGIKQQIGDQFKVTHWQPLRTLVAHTSRIDLAEADLPLLNEDKLHEAMQSKIIEENPMAFAGKTEDLKSEATRRLSELEKDSRTAFLRVESVREYSRRLPNAELFVANLNRLIRLYMAQFNDFFVEEVTLHQLASNTPLRGVFTLVNCDGSLVQNYGHVGKIPPMMFKTWQMYPDSKVKEFAQLLESGQQPDAIDLMAVRSRNCLEKGAFRSAIVEASAAMDLSLSSKIREGLRAKGQNDSDINEMLRKPQNQRFEARAKSILQSATGQTVPALDNTLWTEVSKHRTVIRQGVTHSDSEPDKAEAKKVVDDFLRLAQLIRTIPVP